MLKFQYKNHRGEITMRTVRFKALQFLIRPGYNYQPGWFLHGYDMDKLADRSFALCNIILPQESRNFTLRPEND